MANTIRLKRGTTEPVAGDLVTGELAINTTDASVYTKLDDGTVSPVVGKSNNLFVTVRNETGVAIPAGSAVYISGASNGKPLITLAQANSEATSSKTLGLTVASISHNNNGSVIAAGLLTKIDTQAYAAGDVLWLSPTVAGGFTTTKPSAPNHAVFIGTVLSSANNGKIEVKVQNGFELQELHNVSITSPTDGQVLKYEASTGLWKNQADTNTGTWGSIGGTLSNQTDLQTALNGKANTTHSHIIGDITGLQTALDGKANLSGATFTGKVNHTSVGGAAGVNIGIGGTSTNATVAGDLWISTGGSNLNFRDGTGAWRVVASQGQINTFSTNQIISGSSTSAMLRITQTGTGHTLVVEDDTNPDTSSFFINNAGRVGIGLDPATATLTVPLTVNGSIIGTTESTSDNSTKVATTAYVKANLVSYATLASPTFTGTPNAPTQLWTTESAAIATTSYVRTQNRVVNFSFYGNMDTTGTMFERYVYLSSGNPADNHQILLVDAGFYNTNGSKFMFRQNDNSQMDFYDANGWVKAPNNDRYYAAFPGAVIFAVKVSTYDWFIYGDLTSTQYPAYGTFISGPAIDTTNTVNSGYTDYYGNTVYAYTAYSTVADGWGGQTNVAATPDAGTVMSDNFTYSMETETYNLLADGTGGYTLNFVSSSGGGGYDPYGTKYGNPYWDSGSGSLLQSIADGSGGSTTIAWDGAAPYPVYGEQVSTTNYGLGDYKTDAIGSSHYVYYDSTYYADGNGGSYESWSISSGYSYPAGWAFDNYHFNTGVPNTSYSFYDEYSNTVYPWTWGYNAADGTGNTYFNATGTPPSGEPASDYFTDNNYSYGRIYADGSGGFYFAS